MFYTVIIFLQELREKIDQACRTAEEFTKVYYESLDKRRHVSSLILKSKMIGKF